MTKEELLKKLDGSYNSAQLKHWVSSLSPSPPKIKPIRLKVGDVFHHEIFNHPVILVKRSKGKWVAISMTSDPNCPVIIEQAISRFFHNSYFTYTLLVLHEVKANNYMGVYDNTPHLKKVFNKIKMIIQ